MPPNAQLWFTPDVIAQQGDPAEGMYYFYSGQARLKENIGGRIMAVGMVQTEDTQGEMSLIGDFLWKQDIVAVEDVVCLVLPAKAIRSLLATHPLLDQHFRSHVGLIEIGNRLKSLLGPMTYSREQLQSILGSVGVKPVKAGNTVFRQGESDPRLYLIEKGRVELVRSALVGGQEVVLDRLDRGSLIMDADTICFIKDGKVREKGRHKQLIDPGYLRTMAYGGLYYGLAQSQFGLPPLKL